MELWIFNHYAISPGSSGITRDYDLAKQLIKKGHTVTIFASSFDHRSRTEKHLSPGELYKEEYIENIRYVWVKTTPYERNNWKRVLNIISYTLRGYKVAKKVTGKPDLIFGTLVHPLAALLGYFVSRKKKSLYYFEERDLWPETLLHLGKISRKHPAIVFLSKLELFLYKKADKIVVLFNKADQYVEQRGIDRNKVIYIPNGVDLERYKHSDHLSDLMQQQFVKLKDKFIAVYTGAHGLANNLEVLLDTASILKENKNIHFLFIGEGVEKDTLIKRKEKEGLDNVTFAPAVPKEEIPAVLKRSDVGLISMLDADMYKWGVSLNKGYDYMAASLPTIIRCSIDETIIEQSGGGFKVKTAEEMADAIHHLYKNSSEALDMGQKARQFVEKYYSWDQLSDRLIESYEEEKNHKNKKQFDMN